MKPRSALAATALMLAALAPGIAAAHEVRPGFLGKGDKIVGMTLAQLGFLTQLGQPVPAVLVDAF